MGTPETVGFGECDHCAGKVAVKKNRAGRAYYHCDHCGFKGEHMWHRTSERVLQGFAIAAPEPAPAPENPANPGILPPKKTGFTILGGKA